jgi:hypothetical protein
MKVMLVITRLLYNKCYEALHRVNVKLYMYVATRLTVVGYSRVPV